MIGLGASCSLPTAAVLPESISTSTALGRVLQPAAALPCAAVGGERVDRCLDLVADDATNRVWLMVGLH